MYEITAFYEKMLISLFPVTMSDSVNESVTIVFVLYPRNLSLAVFLSISVENPSEQVLEENQKTNVFSVESVATQFLAQIKNYKMIDTHIIHLTLSQRVTH